MNLTIIVVSIPIFPFSFPRADSRQPSAADSRAQQTADLDPDLDPEKFLRADIAHRARI